MSNEKYKVSIIVAVYNVDKYIRRCLDSIKHQTHSNIEVLLIDDGSKDTSGKICDDYAASDSRFKVIHKENGGVSRARQTGLDAATGDYIIHVDPDDYIDNNMIGELLSEAADKKTDIITCDFYLDGIYYKQGYKDEEDLLEKVINVRIITACWNVFIKRSFIAKNKIRFTPDWLNQCEDFLFMARLITAGATAAHLNKAYYHYWSYNGNSLTNKRSLKKVESLIATVNELQKLVPANKFDDFFIRKRLILNSLFNEHFYVLLKTTYPEIHQRLISEGRQSSFLSQHYCLSLALNGETEKAMLFQVIQGFYQKVYHILLKIKRIVCT